jgi:hypothetical protein
MTSYPHQGGTSEDKTSADFIYMKMKAYGLDDVVYTDYDVYLDFSDETNFNSVEIKNQSSSDLFEIQEIDLDNNINSNLISKPYLAYSKSGNATSVYDLKNNFLLTRLILKILN